VRPSRRANERRWSPGESSDQRTLNGAQSISPIMKKIIFDLSWFTGKTVLAYGAQSLTMDKFVKFSISIGGGPVVSVYVWQRSGQVEHILVCKGDF